MAYCIAILQGNLTRDVELRFLPTGTAVADFCVAVNRKWTTAEGNVKEEVLFMDCVCFSKRAETLSKYVAKGSSLLVQGYLRQEKWVDKETQQPKSKMRLVVEQFTFLDRKPQGEAGAGSGEEGAGPRGRPTPHDTSQSQPQAPYEDDSDVPF